MEVTLIALKQTIIMFLLIASGYLLFKTEKITKEGSRDLAQTLLYFILPCMIIKSFWTEYSAEKTRALLIAFALSIVCLGLAMLTARILFRKRPIDQFGTAFSNAGFMGIPLIQAVLGNEAVIFSAPFIAVLNILQWTYGVYIMTGKKEAVSYKKILKNPILVGLVIGLLCYFFRITPPAIVSKTAEYISGMNAPVAMIILGVYLAQTDVLKLFTERILYWNSLVRLVLIPLATLAVLSLLPDSLQTAKYALLIVASAPVGSNVAVYAQLNGLDYTYACKTVCMSTLLSIISLPCIMLAANMVWGG